MFSFIFFNKNILESDHFLSDEMRWPRKMSYFQVRQYFLPRLSAGRASPHSPCWLGLCILSQHKVLGEVISYWIFFFFLQKIAETAHKKVIKCPGWNSDITKRKYVLLKVIKKKKCWAAPMPSPAEKYTNTSMKTNTANSGENPEERSGSPG